MSCLALVSCFALFLPPMLRFARVFSSSSAASFSTAAASAAAHVDGPPGQVQVFATRLIWKAYRERFQRLGWAFYDSEEAIPRPLLLQQVAERKPQALLCTLSDRIDKDVIEACGPQVIDKKKNSRSAKCVSCNCFFFFCVSAAQSD